MNCMTRRSCRSMNMRTHTLIRCLLIISLSLERKEIVVGSNSNGSGYPKKTNTENEKTNTHAGTHARTHTYTHTHTQKMQREVNYFFTDTSNHNIISNRRRKITGSEQLVDHQHKLIHILFTFCGGYNLDRMVPI